MPNQQPYYYPSQPYYYPRPERSYTGLIFGLLALGVGAGLFYYAWLNNFWGIFNGGTHGPCTVDDDCPPGYKCTDSRCYQEKECNSNADCAEGEKCIGGYCVPEGQQNETLPISGTAMSTLEGINQGPIEGCYVKFTNTSTQEIWSAFSNIEGYWQIDNIKIGVYSVHADAPHHANNDFPYVPLTPAQGYYPGPGPGPNGTWPVAVTTMMYLPYFVLKWNYIFTAFTQVTFDLEYHQIVNHLEGTITCIDCLKVIQVYITDTAGNEERILETGGAYNPTNIHKHFSERKATQLRIVGLCWDGMTPALTHINLVLEQQVFD